MRNFTRKKVRPRRSIVAGKKVKRISDAEIPYAYNSVDWLGESGVETSISALYVINYGMATYGSEFFDLEDLADDLEEDIKGRDYDHCPVIGCYDDLFLVCSECGGYFTTGDWGEGAICPACYTKILGDSRDWTDDQHEFWDADSVEDLDLDRDWVKKAKYVQKLLNKKPTKIHIVSAAKEALGI